MGQSRDPSGAEQISNPAVRDLFCSWPDDIRDRLLAVRWLILETARDTTGVGSLEETLKRGDPSCLARGGSTVRIHWKPASPDRYAVCFHCAARLVATFRELYSDQLSFEGNRATLSDRQQRVPTTVLRHCIALALTWQRLKHLPLLGA